MSSRMLHAFWCLVNIWWMDKWRRVESSGVLEKLASSVSHFTQGYPALIQGVKFNTKSPIFRAWQIWRWLVRLMMSLNLLPEYTQKECNSDNVLRQWVGVEVLAIKIFFCVQIFGLHLRGMLLTERMLTSCFMNTHVTSHMSQPPGVFVIACL